MSALVCHIRVIAFRHGCRSRAAGTHNPWSSATSSCAYCSSSDRYLSSHDDSSQSFSRPNGGTDTKRVRSRPLSLGYVAGLQSHSKAASSSHEDDDEDVTWSSFDEAYGILEQIDPQVLYEFEENLWDENNMRFIHSTRDISVIDMEITGEDKAVRSLVFNARPKLIQSSIEIEHVGATSGPKVFGAPPPLVGLTATHLGGLALAVPLWLASNKKTLPPAKDGPDRPRAVVIGAGGCTIPAVLAKVGCDITAIEPHADVHDAARQYFGADDANIKLIIGYGEQYLSENDSKDLNKTFDLLLIDAEDGKSAPPQTMREESFWTGAVAPHLASNAVVAVNIIANEDDRFQLTRIIDRVLQGHDVWCCDVPDIANISDRHCIMFATPQTKEDSDGVLERFNKEMDEFAYVDMPVEWSKLVEQGRLFSYNTKEEEDDKK